MKKWLHVKGKAQTIAYWFSAVMSVYAVWRIADGSVSPDWLILSFVSHLWCVLTITAGYHRLFAHQAYRCSRLWHAVFAFTGTAFFQGSPLSWAAVHHAHHKFADTERDSHITDWRYWMGRPYGPILKTKQAFVHLMRDPMHMVFHKYGLLAPIGVCAVLGAISLNVLLYGYCLPLGLFFLYSNIHQSFSHRGGKPRNQPWLEFIFPAGGEWTHATHHENPGLWRFGLVDPGAVLIKCIKHD